MTRLLFLLTFMRRTQDWCPTVPLQPLWDYFVHNMLSTDHYTLIIYQYKLGVPQGNGSLWSARPLMLIWFRPLVLIQSICHHKILTISTTKVVHVFYTTKPDSWCTCNHAMVCHGCISCAECCFKIFNACISLKYIRVPTTVKASLKVDKLGKILLAHAFFYVTQRLAWPMNSPLSQPLLSILTEYSEFFSLNSDQTTSCLDWKTRSHCYIIHWL